MNDKPKLLYVSPFPPKKSGISDYSVLLVEALSEKYDITLFTDKYEISVTDFSKKYKVLKLGKDTIHYDEYPYIIYNIGNNPYYHDYIYEMCLEHPGMVILHDFVIYYLFIGYYQKREMLYTKVYENAGRDALIKIKRALKQDDCELLTKKELAVQLPLNEELLSSGNYFMVHSEYAKNQVLALTDRVKKINMIQQVATDFRVIEKAKLYKKYCIPEDAIVVAAFGIVADTKQNHVACKVVKKLAEQYNICYVMVGEGDYVDCYVDNKVIFKTGFVKMDEFDSFIANSDIVLNLRYPTMGETSAALVKILQMGKCCMINDNGWFSEIPSDCAVKIDIDNIEQDLFNKIEFYLGNKNAREEVEKNASEFIKREFSEQAIVSQICNFLEESKL